MPPAQHHLCFEESDLWLGFRTAGTLILLSQMYYTRYTLPVQRVQTYFAILAQYGTQYWALWIWAEARRG